jgi:hypothetical protein
MSDPILRVFLDRSVGTRMIAAALRELEIDVETIQDRYGQEASTVADVRWIEDATRDDRVLIGADQRIRYNPLERSALCQHAARCFTFPRGNLTATEMIARLTLHLPEIICLAAINGPCVFHLNSDRVTRMKLDCTDIDP